MKKSFIILMSIAGFSALQVTASESNLTKNLRSASYDSESSEKLELTCNPMCSPKNRRDLIFVSIQNGDTQHAAEFTADLHADNKVTDEQLKSILRAAVQSRTVNSEEFVAAFNQRNRMNSPHYIRFTDALNDDNYNDEQKAEIKKTFDAYMRGDKITSLSILSPRKK